MPPRPLTAIRAIAACVIAQGLLTLSAAAQQPGAYPGVYLPVAVNTDAGDPYALTGNSVTTSGFPTLLTPSSLIVPGGPVVGHPTRGRRFWFNTEYLLWKTDGMNTPPLVTTSPPGTPREIAAVLGEPGTTILFGSRRLNDDATSGVRIGMGWFSPNRNYGIETEYFRLGQQVTRYRNGSDGSVILGRPFFDILNGRETAQLISYPDLVSGAVAIDAKSNLQSAMIAGRAALCPEHGHACDCDRGSRVDWLLGYRYLEMNDELTINEGLTSLLEDEPGSLQIVDRFETFNQFNGLQLGIAHRATYHRAWLESMLRVAMGGNRQTVRIFGGRQITEDGITDSVEGGLLAQPSNIGSFRRNEFVMVPELGLKFGMRLTKCFHSTIGFTALYLPNVVRAGDQVDTDLNPSFLDEDDFVGAPRPRLTFITTDYWAYGMTLGGELRF